MRKVLIIFGVVLVAAVILVWRMPAHEGIDFDFRSRGPADIFTEGHGTSYLRDYELSIQLKIASDRGDLESFMQQLGGKVSPHTYRYNWQGNF